MSTYRQTTHGITITKLQVTRILNCLEIAIKLQKLLAITSGCIFDVKIFIVLSKEEIVADNFEAKNLKIITMLMQYPISAHNPIVTLQAYRNISLTRSEAYTLFC